MPATFHARGVHFRYPENWTVEPGEIEEGWSAAVQSPGTAFLMVSVHEKRPEVADVLAITLDALREDYPDLEAEPVTERIAGRQARGYDVRFFSLDLVNTCWIRCLRTSAETVLVMCQANDLDLDVAEPVLAAIRASLALTDEENDA